MVPRASVLSLELKTYEHPETCICRGKDEGRSCSHKVTSTSSGGPSLASKESPDDLQVAWRFIKRGFQTRVAGRTLPPILTSQVSAAQMSSGSNKSLQPTAVDRLGSAFAGFVFVSAVAEFIRSAKISNTYDTIN